MGKSGIPVYHIDNFRKLQSETEFYANALALHLKQHHFIAEPHKHDFHITILFTQGSGVHEIDFSTYPVKPGAVFFLSPGQTHNWKLSANCDGYIFFHSAAFYDLNFTSRKIKSYPFFASIYNMPLLQLKSDQKNKISVLFREVLEEYKENCWMKQSKLCSLADLIYIELARLYSPIHANKALRQGYLDRLAKLETLIDEHYKTIKFPKDYAERLNLSEKHLNRICRECLNKSTGDLITDRVITEAKRLLIISKLSVAQIAEELGYLDASYFSRLFRKKTGQTPMEFIKQYQRL